MKGRKRLAMKNITKIFTAAVLAVSTLCGTTPGVAGLPLSFFILLLLTVLYTGCWSWNIRRGDKGLWRLECKADLAVLALIAWNLLSIAGKLLQDTETRVIRYQFQAILIILGLLYFEWKEVKVVCGWYLDLILYAGLLVTGRLLLFYLGVWETGWMSDLAEDSGRAASYLLLLCMVSVFRYCFCRDRMQSAFYLLVAAVNFFTLFINYNIPSLWIMVFVFFAIPVVMRPTAELVRRDMQLFFLYGFMLSNMSLLTNYTHQLLRKPELSLEHSIYLELLLAVGGLFFFRYWDRIPAGVDRDRLVLRKMRRGYLFVLKLLGIVFAILILGGGAWAGLPDTPDASVGPAFVRSFAVPLNKAVGMGKSGWICCLENSGVSTLLLLILTVLLAVGMTSNHSFAKPQTAGYQLIALAFAAQTFFWPPDINVLPVYLLFTVWAVFYREQKQRVRTVKINFNKEGKENEEKNGLG